MQLKDSAWHLEALPGAKSGPSGSRPDAPLLCMGRPRLSQLLEALEGQGLAWVDVSMAPPAAAATPSPSSDGQQQAEEETIVVRLQQGDGEIR
jgi:hypothetical protein